jgi:hypothetical protein
VSNEVYIDPNRLAEEITFLKEYREIVSDERFLEIVASRAVYLSSKCKEYRILLAEHGIMKNGPRAD